MERKYVSVLMALGFSLTGTLSASPAQTVTCSVNMERAYNEAVRRGWNFKCETTYVGASVGFGWDNAKRMGCSGKTPAVLPTPASYRASLFMRGGGSSANLSEGWKLAGYQVVGGQYLKDQAAGGRRINFFWKQPKPNTLFKRYITNLRFSKKGGSCAKLYDEAFN